MPVSLHKEGTDAGPVLALSCWSFCSSGASTYCVTHPSPVKITVCPHLHQLFPTCSNHPPNRCQLLPQVLKATNGCFLCSATPKQARKDPFVMNLTNQLSLTETSNGLLFIIILFVHFKNIFWRQIALHIARQIAYSNWTLALSQKKN